MQQRRPVRHVLLSVSDKVGTAELAQALSARGVGLLSIGGTARLLAGKGLPVTEVSGYTGLPEMMDGRVKTLHPKIHGDILDRHGLDDTIMEEHQILPIDMVVVNLYPFAQTVTREGCLLEDTVKNIGIGGPTMVRSTAKNHKDTTIVVKSSDYDAIIREMDTNKGSLALTTRFGLVIKAFGHTAAYDSMIVNYFGSMVPAYRGGSKEAAGHFPCALSLNFVKEQDMRYGENSHQQVAFYIEENMREASVATATQVQGKALSYNNIVDTDAALECVKEFAEPAYVVVKYANPCGVAIGHPILDVYDRVYKTSPTSAFGSIIAFNRKLDTKIAQTITSRQFVEAIIASSASEEVLRITAAKQNVCVLARGQWGERVSGLDSKHVNGGLLVQNRDLGMVGTEELRVIIRRRPNEQELRDALFCRKMAKFVKSNAIIYTKNNVTIGIGTDQMSRAYSTKIVGIKAADEGLEVKGSSMASDAFFPFRDGVDTTAAVDVTCVIQPSSSTRNDEVIAATDEHGVAMLFTDMRHFRHWRSNR